MIKSHHINKVSKADGFCFGVLVLVAMSMLVSERVEAEEKGSLYVHQHIASQNLKQSRYAQPDIYVYKPDGTIVHSGIGTGSFKAGSLIELNAGKYLVEVGRHRTRQNLQRYKVTAKKVTVVKTGWVSVSTWERSSQPTGSDCSKWDSGMRAMRVVEGKEYLIMANAFKRPGATSMMQLPVGKFRVYFNGLATDVEIKEDKIYHLPVGEAGPFRSSRVRIFAEKSERGGVPSVSLCDRISSHVLAGKWWRSETIKIDDHPYEKQVWSEYEVDVADGGVYKSLNPDSIKGTRHKTSTPSWLNSSEISSLSGYKEGALTKSIGGKFKGTTLESLFEDSTDVR